MLFDNALAQFSAYQLTAGGRARATVDSYARDLEQFGELAGIGQLAQLDRTAVIRWLNALAGLELAPRSRARKLSALRSFIGWAMEYNLLAVNPIPTETANARALYLPHSLSEGEVTAMIEAAAQGEDPESVRNTAILEMLYATGMRVSELSTLQLVDVYAGEAFAIVMGKGGKQRLVPIGRYALDALEKYLAVRGALCKNAMRHGEVFLTKRGPISRATVFRIVKRCAELAGVKSKVSPHTFRHSCASHMLAHGADLRMVQELLGHANLSTTQIYTHIDKHRLREVYDRTHPLA